MFSDYFLVLQLSADNSSDVPANKTSVVSADNVVPEDKISVVSADKTSVVS